MKTQSRSLTRNGLTVACDFGKDGRLERKTERLNGHGREFTYEFDAKGHLLEVRRDNSIVEIYRYNAKGQRTMHRCLCGGLDAAVAREYEYDHAGRLVQAGELSFAYDRSGALCQRRDHGGSTFFRYDGDTRLDGVTLPDGGEIRYEYDQATPINPVRRFKNGRLTHQYAWRDPLRLYACLDHDAGVEYQFTYDAEGRLDRLRLLNLGIAGERADPAFADRFLDDRERARRDALRGFFANGAKSLELLCCTDQVGTLRALIKAGTLSTNSWTMKDIIDEAYAKCDPHKIAHHVPTGPPKPNSDLTGWAIKEIWRDSFGNPYYDSFPDFFLPIGFAGGLEDPDTGLVRFGWRDYDPAVGRFTAPDPLGDTGGDHDLYDYCVDDPVSMRDPTGLLLKNIFGPTFGNGITLAEAIAYGGLYTAAGMADGISGFAQGGKVTKCRDGVDEAWKIYDNIFHGDIIKNTIKEKIGEWWNRE